MRQYRNIVTRRGDFNVSSTSRRCAVEIYVPCSTWRNVLLQPTMLDADHFFSSKCTKYQQWVTDKLANGYEVFRSFTNTDVISPTDYWSWSNQTNYEQKDCNPKVKQNPELSHFPKDQNSQKPEFMSKMTSNINLSTNVPTYLSPQPVSNISVHKSIIERRYLSQSEWTESYIPNI